MKESYKSEKNNILLITGHSAELLVRKYAPKNIDIMVMPVDVAAFITKNIILKNISKEVVQKYDLIMVPGLVQDDLTDLRDILGIPVVKGPKYASDIKTALTEIDPFVLSPIYAADRYLKKQKLALSEKILSEGFSKPLDEKDEFYIGSKSKFIVGLSRPPLVMAEIVDAPKLTKEEVLERAHYYLENGADILDIGAVANYPNPVEIKKIFQILRPLQEKEDFAISIDTLNTEEIHAAIKSGVDIILSIDHSNVDQLKDEIPQDIGIVYVPTNVAKGILPNNIKDRIESLLKLKNQLMEAGLTKLFADPIIEMPIYPGFTQSLTYYNEYRKVDSKTPMMMCIGNVTEFIAADPIGINALFGCIAVELGIQLLLVTDVSIKCRGGIKEVVTARNMAFVAQQTYKPPKDQGINLLFAKSRTAVDLDIIQLPKVETIELESIDNNLLYNLNYELDPKGSFTIWTNYHKQKMFVSHLAYKSNKADLLLISSKAKPIFDEIIKRNLISNIGHAYYLGRELERAEICLFLGKTYIQNEQSFKNTE
ncbi:MAG: dihydropteroate synthase-like protein [Candidatus Heimdallarchaeota archaeon]|nr:dihydropteroate synthase-like protein [Candidatus Heimdallarchaeota archaeon]